MRINTKLIYFLYNLIMSLLTPISLDALNFIKRKDKQKELCDKFSSLETFPPVSNPSAYFLAGSPGAGKTEYSKSFIKGLEETNPKRKIVRIDPDEIREFIPQYNHRNTCEIHSAAYRGVDILLNHVFKYNQEFLLDGTFAHYQPSRRNVERAIRDQRNVGILYIYQNPLVAWDFTKKREAFEGRNIPKDVFINDFFAAKENVNKIKEDFKDKVEIWLIVKNNLQGVERTEFNIKNIDYYIPTQFSVDSLQTMLK
jgi:UDP-N-acetylglucosamine kinase